MTALRDSDPTDWILALGPGASASVHPPASSADGLAEATGRLGTGPVAWAVGVGYDLAHIAVQEVPELGDGPGQFETLRMGTESVVLRTLLLLADPDAGDFVTEEALLGDREFARRRIGLGNVLRGIRLAHAELVRALMSACQELVPPAGHARQFRRISERLFGLVDDFSSRMTAEYLAEHDRWVTSGAAAREETARMILDGEPVQEEAAGQSLGYPLAGHHLAFVAWSDAEVTAPTTELQQAAARFLRHRGCTVSVIIPTGRTSLWAWGSPSATEGGAGQAEPQLPPDVRVACGSVRAGMSGFRQTHQEAQQAARVMRLNPRPAQVLDYPDVAVASLLSSDLPAIRSFVHDELGPLAVDSPHMEQLRETLRLYLRNERGLAASAARLHVARNTVTYRVKRAQELVGHDFGTRLLDVLAALEAAHVLGGAVLRPVSGDTHDATSRRGTALRSAE
ncbi:PucR family transcriptional regulator [Streptomyces sp. NPDC056337]|uniref:PucR family transcriptional regulator n=1 Tax=Streptomyces sp. NPDC056337 TaxID=3345787 RepID=UPI0035DF49D5